MRIRIATRKSELALWQANHVAALLRSQPDVDEVTLVPLTTRGDRVLDRSLDKIGGKGLFIKELEVAMRRGEADIAVHSMKDVPAELADGFRIAAVLRRADPRDALVFPGGGRLEDLPRGAVVGSSSLRRRAQLLALRPDLEILPLRGNVNTRLGKLDAGEFDAVVLACAGLERLGLAGRIAERLAPGQMLPATAQGVIGIECLETRAELAALLARLEDPAARQTTLAERAVARVLGATCHSPLASYAVLEGSTLTLTAMVASADGQRVLRSGASGGADAAAAIGEGLARELLAQGAAQLLQGAENP